MKKLNFWYLTILIILLTPLHCHSFSLERYQWSAAAGLSLSGFIGSVVLVQKLSLKEEACIEKEYPGFSKLDDITKSLVGERVVKTNQTVAKKVQQVRTIMYSAVGSACILACLFGWTAEKALNELFS